MCQIVYFNKLRRNWWWQHGIKALEDIVVGVASKGDDWPMAESINN